MKIKCDICGCKLREPGALVFAPPVKSMTRKWHVCVSCFKYLKRLFLEVRK